MSEPTLRDAAAAIELEYAGVDVHAVVGDFERHLDRLPVGGTRVVAFLGGTIGNLDPDARADFFGTIAAGLRSGDAFLLGTDLVKDTERLESAYDDAAGVTAAFNRNVLSVLNRELDADFEPEGFDHLARWNPDAEWIEMRLRSNRAAVREDRGARPRDRVRRRRRDAHRDQRQVPSRRGREGTGRRRPRADVLVDRPRGRLRAVSVGPRLRL